MTKPCSELKAALRRQFRAEAKKHPPAECSGASKEICERLQEQSGWRQARSVLLFFPLLDEPDIQPLMAQALASGKTITLPRHEAPNDEYTACQVLNPGIELRSGRFGVLEPTQKCPVVPINELDFILVPGIAFTPLGARLGRGKGYYDRWLAQAPGVKCGVAFDWQVTVEIPMERHDIYVDCVCTPSRWHEVTGRCRLKNDCF